ncbi:MAG TPA: hypothetical protein VJ965_01570 [Anaerolineales bacterium]|nr:hypothetical protein [Anaerolineales bacterium]
MEEENNTEQQVPFKQLIRNFLIEVAVYGVLLVVYFFVALRYLGDPLARLFDSNLLAYAVIGLGLIVVQAVVLESVTSLLFDFLGLHRLTSGTPKH